MAFSYTLSGDDDDLVVQQGRDVEGDPAVAWREPLVPPRDEPLRARPATPASSRTRTIKGPTGISSWTGARHVPAPVRLTRWRIIRPGWRYR